MNKVMLVTRIASDIELRTTQSGHSCVSIAVALDNGKDKDGNKRKADFVKVAVFNEQAENLAKYQKKGNLIEIEGRLRVNNWLAQDGTKRYETYVMAERIGYLNTKPKEETPIPEPDYVPKDINNMTDNEILDRVINNNNPFTEFSEEADLNGLNSDDLPF